MKEYSEEDPINARIKIDYTGVKPNVRFSYPDKKNQVKGSMFCPVVFMWIILNLTFAGLWGEMMPDGSIFRWILIFYMLGTPCLIYFPFRKKWNKLYPDYQALTAKKKYRKFLPSDVKKEGKEYCCEVPLFNNVLLDYNATKDFSRYLKYFEIREHKFYHLKRVGFKRKISKKKINEFLWYAKFYFSKKPEKGSLAVVFK